MSLLTDNNGLLLFDMSLLYPKVKFGELIDAPDEWLRVLYPEIDQVRMFGPNFSHIYSFEDDITLDKEARDEFFAVAIKQGNIFTDKKRWPYSIGNFDRLQKAREHLSFVETNVNYPRRIWPKVNEWAKSFGNPFVSGSIADNPLIETGLSALQHRHFTDDHSNPFTMEDYYVLTVLYNTHWGKLHPEDGRVK